MNQPRYTLLLIAALLGFLLLTLLMPFGVVFWAYALWCTLKYLRQHKEKPRPDGRG